MKMNVLELINRIKSKDYKIPLWLMFLLSAIIGGISFVMIYGISIIDVSNDSWLYNSGGDLAAHYLGWLFYRQSSWHFPIGIQDQITYPNSFSIIYMDSIPLFALVFKLLSPLLPDVFQYFGIYGLITFSLMGIIGSGIIYSKTKDSIYGLISAPFFVLSSTVIQRMYNHSALAFHPIILLAILLYINRGEKDEHGRDVLYWGLLLILSVSIQAYFFPMCFLLMLGYYSEELFSKNWYKCAIKIVLLLLITFMAMYVWGYFYGGHDYNGGGFGAYNGNITSLLNSQGNSFFEKLHGVTECDNNWETFAYLGYGVIVLCIISAFDLLYNSRD